MFLLALVGLRSLQYAGAQSLPEIERPGAVVGKAGTFFGAHFTCGGVGVAGGNGQGNRRRRTWAGLSTTKNGGASWSAVLPPNNQDIKGNPFVVNENEAW